MIFLKRAKKYITKRLDNVKFYTDTSYGIIINNVIYGGVINNGNQFEYFIDVTHDDLNKFWCKHDDTIINDEETYSHKFIRIFKLEKKIEYFDHKRNNDYDVYCYISGFYYINNKTLHQYYCEFDNANIMEIFVLKIRI